MNSVAERRNVILKDMVRNIISHSTLLELHLGEALETTSCILKKVPTKAIAKHLMSFE